MVRIIMVISYGPYHMAKLYGSFIPNKKNAYYESQINGFNGIEFNAYSIDSGYPSPKFSTIDMFKLAM